MRPDAARDGRRRRIDGLVRRLAIGGALLVGLSLLAPRPGRAQDAVPAGASVLREGRFEVVHFAGETRFAHAVLAAAIAGDSFPGLPPLTDTVRIQLSPDARTFREWVGAGAPDWGGAFAFPTERLIVMQGRNAAVVGDPMVTLRHELAHLALAEVLRGQVPRWFDEGYASYAAGEWGRQEVLATSVGLIWRGIPTLAGLDSGFYAGSGRAERTYALAYRAVAELASLDRERGLTLFFEYWEREGSFERALRSAFGMTSADFERHWRSRVRRQYGALALAADLSVLSVFLVFLLGPLWWQRRRRLQDRLARMRQADAAQEERERTGALAILLGEGAPDRPGPAEPSRGAD